MRSYRKSWSLNIPKLIFTFHMDTGPQILYEWRSRLRWVINKRVKEQPNTRYFDIIIGKQRHLFTVKIINIARNNENCSCHLTNDLFAVQRILVFTTDNTLKWNWKDCSPYITISATSTHNLLSSDICFSRLFRNDFFFKLRQEWLFAHKKYRFQNLWLYYRWKKEWKYVWLKQKQVLNLYMPQNKVFFTVLLPC